MAGFWDTLQSFVPETERTKMYRSENALRLRALEREERAAQREEENLLRRKGMADFALSPSLEASYPGFVAQNQQRNALDRADPAAALGRLEAKLYPGPEEIIMGKPGEVPLSKRTGAPVGEAVPGGGEPFAGKNMQIPGTDRVVYARTQDEMDRRLAEGFVPVGNSVPGAKEPAKAKSPRDILTDKYGSLGDGYEWQENPDGTAAPRIMPGGPVAVSLGKDVSTPVRRSMADARAAEAGVTTMEGLSTDDTGGSDIALIYNFFTALDPASRVTQSEFDTAGMAKGVSESIMGALRQAKAGKILTSKQRSELVSAAKRAAASRKNLALQEYNSAKRTLTNLGLNIPQFLDADGTEGWSITKVDQ